MTSPLRIANIVNVAPRKLGSGEDSILALVEGASRRGHKMDVFTFSPVHPGVSNRLDAANSRWTSAHALSGHPFASARRLGKDYDLLVLNLFAPRSLIARIAYAAIPAKVVLVDNFSAVPADANSASRLSRILDRLTTVRMAGLIAVSDYVLRRDMARFHIASPFARRIYNGVDPLRFVPPTTRPPGPPTALAVANLIPEKGLHVLIEAFARIDVPTAELMIVGDGPELRRLKELARLRGLESRVTFLGLRDDVDALLSRAHVFIHPCIWEEAFGLTIAEAMATGCVVIASRIGATAELVTDGKSGLLVPPGDVDALAAAVSSVLLDSTLREALGRNARQQACEQFSLEGSTNQHLDFYEELVGR